MSEQYEFVGGFPAAETARRVYDEVDLNRAVQCYRMFYPSVSGLAIFKGNRVLGLVDNEVFGTLQTQPKHPYPQPDPSRARTCDPQLPVRLPRRPER